MSTNDDTIPRHFDAETKIYKKRWIIILIYFLFSATSSFQWMQLSIIANIIQKYYGVSSSAINWTSMIYMLFYAPLIIVGSYVLNVKGLRVAGLIGAIGTFLAAAIKICALRPDLFYVILIAQIVASVSQVFFLSSPSKISAVWFKPSEMGLVVTIGVNGTQMGFALGFLVPTALVRNHDDIDSIGADLSKLYWGQAILMLPIAIATIFFYHRQPPLPPTLVQAEERNRKVPTWKSFWKSFVILLKKRDFIIHLIAYGTNVGGFLAIGTFLNQFILNYFPNAEEDAGRMGLLMIIAGMLGSTAFGVYLDKFHKYKETTLFIYYLTVFSVLAFLVAMYFQQMILTYIAVCAVGLCTNSYIAVGFEFGVEVTFPADEGTTTGLLNAAVLTFGVVFTLLLEQLHQFFGPFWSLIALSALLIIGVILTHLVPNVNRRQDAFEREKNGDVMLKLMENNRQSQA